MSRYKIMAAVCFAAVLGVVGLWVAAGGHMVTQYSVIKEVEEDDGFGDMVKTTAQVNEFRLGMLPDKPWDGALVWILLLGGVGGAMLVVDWKKRQQAQAA
jgi:hypothetical protein